MLRNNQQSFYYQLLTNLKVIRNVSENSIYHLENFLQNTTEDKSKYYHHNPKSFKLKPFLKVSHNSPFRLHPSNVFMNQLSTTNPTSTNLNLQFSRHNRESLFNTETHCSVSEKPKMSFNEIVSAYKNAKCKVNLEEPFTIHKKPIRKMSPKKVVDRRKRTIPRRAVTYKNNPVLKVYIDSSPDIEQETKENIELEDDASSLSINNKNKKSLNSSPIELFSGEESQNSDEEDYAKDDEGSEESPKKECSEIQTYLKDNYQHVRVGSKEFLKGGSRLKEYAVLCDRAQMAQILEFITHRQTAFIRIWILMSKANTEVAFLFKQTHSVKRAFYQRHFGMNSVKFWALKDYRYTPSNVKEFVVPFKDVVTHNFFQHGKAKSNFLKDLDKLEKESNYGSINSCFNFSSEISKYK